MSVSKFLSITIKKLRRIYLKPYHIFILLSLCFISFESTAKNCQEIRGGFDVGSGSTKTLVAKIDVCQKKILEVLYSDSKPVAYNEDLEKSTEKKLGDKVIGEGLEAMTSLLASVKKFKPARITGVATSVFRNAKNGTEVINSFSKKLGFKIEVISQQDEALLGFLSAKSLVGDEVLKNNPPLMWDIGGGSMQMMTFEGKKPLYYLGVLASVTFKNMIIEVLQGKNLETASSPNPIGDKYAQALSMARFYSKLHVPLDLRQALKGRTVIGIGGVHSIALKNMMQLKEMNYSLSQLAKDSSAAVLKADQDLTGDYRSTDVSNMILVQGFMEGLGIDEVRLVSASLLQGIVLK